MSTTREFQSYTYSEGKTALGQLVEFTSAPEDEDKIKETLAITRTVTLPVPHKVNVQHAWYGKYSRYDIEQLKYAGGGGESAVHGYIEALDIKNPPDNRAGAVVHEYDTLNGSIFTEYQTVKLAVAAFESTWSYSPRTSAFETVQSVNALKAERYAQLPGFMRLVPCGDLTPWFYAVGDQDLIGDYAFPEGLQDDPVFKFGQKCVVDSDGTPAIKTCLGTRYVEGVDRQRWMGHEDRPYQKRIVYFNDGTTWIDNLESNRGYNPRPLKDEELWVADAMQQFQALLAGKQTEFEINFAIGGKFVGKFKPENPKQESKQGRYNCKVTMADGSIKAGWQDFTPSPEYPTLQQYITKKFEKGGQKVERIELELLQTEKNGKKWSGVFYGRVDSPQA